MDILKSLGKNIRDKRIGLNISQEELAFRADLHRTYIGAVERGEKNITITSLKKITDALKSSISDITLSL